MTRKQLLERKNETINLMEKIVNKAQMECRELDPTEKEMYENLKKQVLELTNKIKSLFDDTTEIDKEDPEKRSLVDSILANKTIELRDMSTTTHGNAVATNLFEQISKKIAEKSNILNDVPTVQNYGDMEFLSETDVQTAEFVGETDSVSHTDLSAFKKIKLSDKRLSTAIVVSRKLLNNSPISEEYLMNLISDRMANGLEKAILADTTVANGITQTIVSEAESTKIISTSLTIDNIMSLITSLKQQYLAGAKIIVNRETFEKLCILRDMQGRYYIVNGYDHATQTPSYSILGVPVVISEYISANKILLANMQASSVLKYSEGITITPLLEKYIESGSIGIVADFGVDFGVINTDAIKLLELTPAK